MRRRGLLAALALLLALGPLACAANKAWKEWYWSEFRPDAALPTSIDRSNENFIFSRYLWFHVTRFYAVAEPAALAALDDPAARTVGADVPFSQNVAVARLPFPDVAAHHANLVAGLVKGTTLWLDFPFPAFPENMGHWGEVLAPLYSCLADGAWRSHCAPADNCTHINALLFPNLHRENVKGLPWVMDMLRLALRPGLASPRALPRLLFADDLEALNATAWLGFERVLYVHNRYTLASGRSGFATPAHAAAFRESAYEAAGVTTGGPAWKAGVAPPVITYLMAMNHEPVVNNGEVLDALRAVGDQLGMSVRPYSVTPQASFASHVGAMARTGVLVGRHGPLLANALFLPPGALVLELLPYNWEWRGISELYLNLTRSTAALHHFAWKANSSEWVLYLSPDDERYSHWTAEECSSSYCLEAHARAGMVVDTQRLQAMLLHVLPHALAGESVGQLAERLPWPSGAARNGTTGLWWDVTT